MTTRTRTYLKTLPAVTLAGALLTGAAYGAGNVQITSADRQPLPTAQVPRGETTDTVSLNVANAPVQDVLRLLFRRSNQNYVLGPHVAGTVTASLVNVPLDRAVTQLAAANSVHLTTNVVNGIYVIKGPAETPKPAQSPFAGRGRRRRG